MKDIICIIISIMALISEYLCHFVILVLLIRITWIFAKFLFGLISSLEIFNKNTVLLIKNRYEIKTAYLESTPIWVFVTLYFSNDEWLLLKNSEEFKQIPLDGLCEYKNPIKANKVSFGLSYNHWCTVESSQLFKAIINGKISYKSITVKTNNKEVIY